MLVPIERLLRRRDRDGIRARELADVTKRLRVERAERSSTAEREAALSVRALKLALSRATGEVTACASCAAGKELPRGMFAGGDCCSSPTAGLFDDVEVAALAQTGTRPRDLVSPRTPHAGCAFRGERGCTLQVEHRPTVCVRYACDGLRRELHRTGRLDEVEALAVQLHRAVDEFAAARERRVELAMIYGDERRLNGD